MSKAADDGCDVFVGTVLAICAVLCCVWMLVCFVIAVPAVACRRFDSEFACETEQLVAVGVQWLQEPK